MGRGVDVEPVVAGRRDDAPVVGFEGDAEFPLNAGAIGDSLARTVAVFGYGRRFHTLALFVVRADGRPWPTRGLGPLGAARASGMPFRGFPVLLWRSGDRGYAVVSNVGQTELLRLGVKAVESA